MKLYLIRQLFQRTHILCCNYKPFLWCGVVKACVTVIWKLLKRCAFECCQHCVDTNYSECGHKLGSNSSLFGGWIYLTLLTHSKIFCQCSHFVFVPLMTITNRNDKEAVRQLLLAAVAVPGALWGTSCLFLVFIGSSIWQRLIIAFIFSHYL